MRNQQRKYTCSSSMEIKNIFLKKKKNPFLKHKMESELFLNHDFYSAQE